MPAFFERRKGSEGVFVKSCLEGWVCVLIQKAFAHGRVAVNHMMEEINYQRSEGGLGIYKE